MEPHPSQVRAETLALLHSGSTYREVADLLNVPHGTIGWWLHEDRRAQGISANRHSDCPRCTDSDLDHSAYAYLLGLYLGDGHIVSKTGQHHLSIYCGDTWPGIIEATATAMRKVLPAAGVGRHTKTGCTEVKSYSNHWPCLFPQHGPGRKHERRIVLEGWQRKIVDEYPWGLIRGLIHSDGCRVTNWTVRTVGGERRRYEYPRYLFTNKSEDILGICGAALSRVGVGWRVTRRAGAPYNVSVARRGAVALMDEYVGPKF